MDNSANPLLRKYRKVANLPTEKFEEVITLAAGNVRRKQKIVTDLSDITDTAVQRDKLSVFVNDLFDLKNYLVPDGRTIYLRVVREALDKILQLGIAQAPDFYSDPSLKLLLRGDELHEVKQKNQLLEVQNKELEQRLREQNEETRILHRQNNQDSMTKLFNAAYFYGRTEQDGKHKEGTLEKEVKEANKYHRPLSIIVFDFDHFKHINDNYGHAAGDFVLSELWKLLPKRDTDIGCRIGGEEFAVLLPQTVESNAAKVGEQLRNNIASYDYNFNNQKLPVTISAGVAQLREGETPQAFLARADRTLYKAKNLGRNAVVSATEWED